jgi:hypothetical protein
MFTQNSLGLQQIRNLEHEHTQLVKMNKHQNDKQIFRKLRVQNMPTSCGMCIHLQLWYPIKHFAFK